MVSIIMIKYQNLNSTFNIVDAKLSDNDSAIRKIESELKMLKM